MRLKLGACLAAAVMFGGTMHAQEGDSDDTVSYLMKQMDADGDGKITKAEVKKAAEADAEGGTDSEKLESYGNYLQRFLAQDADDDDVVTREELTKFVTASEAGEKVKFSAGDWATYCKEYLDPAFKSELKLYDTDKDSAISKKEAEAIEDFPAEVFDQLDADKDGKLTGAEFNEFIRGTLKENYALEEDKAEPDTETPEIPAKVKENFGKVDADGDGFISKAEMKKAMAEGQANRAYWWGVYIAFLSMDANDDMKADINEYYAYGKDENEGTLHLFYPKDRTEALKEIWSELDGDADGKVVKAEFSKLFPSGGGYDSGEEFDGMDADKSGDVSKDEMWNALKPQFEKGFKFPDADRDAESADNGGGNTNKEAFALYTKVGRSWMTRTTSNFGGAEMVSYMKTEVIEVGDDYSKVKLTMLDQDKKETYSMEQKIEFKTGSGTDEKAPDAKIEEETIKVEAGEFECTRYSMEIDGTKTTSWTSKKYAGLLVKATSEGESLKSTTELVEFNE